MHRECNAERRCCMLWHAKCVLEQRVRAHIRRNVKEEIWGI